ncbi:hypothetical protein [Maridesulfovibrio sp.]|uniref:hypothetical protein n=1 Tax=Maridesulfovibrio sp. TaxID=2795000 RepID=UPI003BABC50F
MAEFVSLLSSLALVFLTAILAWYTRTLANEARATRLQQIQPQVVVTIEPSKITNYMDLVIVNVGSGVARNVQIKADPDFKLEKNKGGHMFNEYSFLEIDVLKPGQEMIHFIGSFKHLSEITTKITSTCTDCLGGEQTFTSVIDVSLFSGLSKLGEDPAERTAKHIEKIATSFSRITDFRRLRVNCYSSDDRQKEREEAERYHEQLRGESSKNNSE